MRIIKLALAALLAVMAISAIVASSASAAFHPSFLTESKLELLVSGEGGEAILRGSAGTVTCEKSLIHGFVLNKSPLIHRLKILFHTNCLLHPTIGNLSTCNEPIQVHLSLGELGLVLGTKTVGILIAPSELAPEFVEIVCTSGVNKIKVNGAVVGEIPEKVGLVNQYNKPLSEITTVFEAEGGKIKQQITSIELLGVNMTGVHLETANFFTGEASEEASAILKGDGKVEICTLLNTVCP
jgi:hypothetical protein